jgi:hypothetical protein
LANPFGNAAFLEFNSKRELSTACAARIKSFAFISF